MVESLGCTLLAFCVAAGGAGTDSGKSAATQPAPSTSPSDTVASPEQLTRVKWNAVLAVLRNKKLKRKAREDQIEKIAGAVIDFPLLAKLALGRRNWRTLTPPQRKRYITLFVELLRRSYRERIAAYEGEQVRFKPRLKGTAKRRSKKTVYIPVELVSRDSTTTILHKFRRFGKKWMIYDIEIEGVSILLTYRSQFDDILRRGTGESLLKRLEQKPTD